MFETTEIFSIPISIKKNFLKINGPLKDYLYNLDIGYKNSTKGSFLSKDYYILNNKKLKNIKNLIKKEIKNYEKEVLGFKNNSLYITNSWISKIEKEGHHPIHNHPNSFISAVFYLDVDNKDENINFHYRSSFFKHFNFFLNKENINKYNANNFEIKVKTGDLIFFPSWLNHSVNYTNNKRLVLSFNCFVKGIFGDDMFPNKLIIK